MRRWVITIMVAVLVILSTANTYAADDSFTYKTVKAGKGYVTKFYDNGKCRCKVYTSKKLKVKVIASSKLTEGKIVNRHNKYLLIERVNGKCLNKKGDGETTDGFYISYRGVKGHKAGRKYTTYCIYGNTKYSDDITGRIDFMR